jgi:hypothetical protein
VFSSGSALLSVTHHQDDAVNASYVEQLRPILQIEKSRAARGLPPKTSSTPHTTRALHLDELVENDRMVPRSSGSYMVTEAVDIPQSEKSSYLQEIPIANASVFREDDQGVRLDILIPDSTEAYPEDDGAKCQPNADDDGCEDEKTILLRHPADRAQIEAEMEDLLNAVPRIKDEYTLLDRLGEGIRANDYA